MSLQENQASAATVSVAPFNELDAPAAAPSPVPKAELKKVQITIAYASMTGMRAEWKAKGGVGSKHMVTGAEVPPAQALLAAIEELARLAAICGLANEAQERVAKSRANVEAWRAEQARAAA